MHRTQRPSNVEIRADDPALTGHAGLLLTGERWTLPGGGIEPGEGVEEALVREVWEEACARVTACALIGWICIKDLDGADDHHVDVEAVYWAAVSLDTFVQRCETTARIEVPLADLARTVFFWPGSEPLVARMVAEASRVEHSARHARHQQ